MRIVAPLVIVIALIAGCDRAPSGPSITVFAAASTAPLLEDVAERYERETGVQVRLNFASSSTLGRQIEGGARADVFISAHPQWMDRLESAELIAPGSRRNYLANQADGVANILPLVLNLTNPSPAIGWANTERMSVHERGPVDLVLALALVHHLAIANNVPLPEVARYFATLTDHLIVEFVDKADSQVQRLLASREDVFPGYTHEGFEAGFGEYFDIEAREQPRGSKRTLYLMKKRASAP